MSNVLPCFVLNVRQKFYVKGSVEERIMEVVKQRQVGIEWPLQFLQLFQCTSSSLHRCLH